MTLVAARGPSSRMPCQIPLLVLMLGLTDFKDDGDVCAAFQPAYAAEQQSLLILVSRLMAVVGTRPPYVPGASETPSIPSCYDFE